MKKIYAFLALTFVAITMQAQTMEFDTFDRGETPSEITADGLVLITTDRNNRMQGAEGNRKFDDGQRFPTRLKTGSRSDMETSQLKVQVPAAGTLTIYAASASVQESRCIAIAVDASSKPIAETTISGANQKPFAVELPAGGEYLLNYPDGAINIYGIVFKAK